MEPQGSEQSVETIIHAIQSNSQSVPQDEQDVELRGTANEPLTFEECEAMRKKGLELIAASKKETDRAVRNSKHEDGVSLLSQASEKIGALFGPENFLCAQFCLDFGSALVRQAQANNDFLGDLSSKPEEKRKEEREDEGGEGDAKDEPSDDLLVAWEVLELARVLYEKECAKTENKEHELALANVFCALAELQMENEEFEQAYEDFLKSLALHKKHKSPGDRDLAVCYSDLAMAAMCLGEKQVEGQVLGHYRDAARVFQFSILEECTKIQQLSNLPIMSKEAPSSELAPVIKSVFGNLEGFEKSLSVIKEAKALLEDIEGKIEDLVNPPSAPNSSSSALSSVLASVATRSESSSSNTSKITTPLDSILMKADSANGTNSSFDSVSFAEKPVTHMVSVKRRATPVNIDSKKPKTS